MHQRLKTHRESCEKKSFFEISSFTPSQCPCSFISYVTNVTAFNKCTDISVKPATYKSLYNMSKMIPNM